ncbi:MAG: phosphatase PAP2 family protein [Bacteroidota bacterium]
MIEKLINMDVALFLFLNGLRNPFFDFVFWWASEPLVWIPIYICLLYFVIKVYRWQALFILLFAAFGVTLTDQISVHLFKDVFMRLRPCHNPMIAMQVHTMNGYCGGDYGFVSSHAANYFGIAAFLSVLMYRKIRHFALFTFLWVSVIAYSRIYLGVHYPADAVSGAILGLHVGFLMGLLYHLFSTKVLDGWRFFRRNEEG